MRWGYPASHRFLALFEVPLVALLLLSAVNSTSPGAGQGPLGVGLAMVLVAGLLPLGRSGVFSQLLPAAVGCTVAYLVQESGAWNLTWALPVTDRRVAPAVICALLVGAAWACEGSSAREWRSWSLGLSCAALFLVGWTGLTTWVVARHLVDPAANAMTCARGLLLLAVIGGVSALAWQSRTVLRRVALITLGSLVVGLARAYL